GDVYAAGEGGHLHGGGEVGRAEDDGLEPGGGGADLLDVDEAPGGLDLGLDADPGLAAGGQLDLGQEEIEGDNLSGALHLGEHDLVEAFGGVLHGVDDVAVGPLGVPGVDPDAEDLVAPVALVDGLDGVLPGGSLLQGRDGVLQVEEDHVGGEALGLLQHLLAGGGDGQAGAAGQVPGAFRHVFPNIRPGRVGKGRARFWGAAPEPRG